MNEISDATWVGAKPNLHGLMKPKVKFGLGLFMFRSDSGLTFETCTEFRFGTRIRHQYLLPNSSRISVYIMYHTHTIYLFIYSLMMWKLEPPTPLCGDGVNPGYTTPPARTMYGASQGRSQYHSVGSKPTRCNHCANNLVVYSLYYI